MAKKKSSKKTKKSLTEDELKLKTVRSAVKQKYGEGAVISAGNVSDFRVFPMQIPTGSLSLDIAIGPVVKLSKDKVLPTGHRMKAGSWQHGIPAGRVLEIMGWESSGKSSLTDHIVGNAQRLGGLCGVLDVEHAKDTTWSRNLGVDFKKLEYSQPDSGEEAIGILELWLKSGLFSLIVLDSIAGLVSKGELKGSVTDSHVGEQARLMSQALRILNPYLSGEDNTTTVLFVNQFRSKINTGGFGGSNKTTPGGNAMKFWAHIRMEAAKIGKIQGDAGDIIGQVMKVTNIKNKVGPPYRSADYIPFYFGSASDGAEVYGIDWADELLALGVQYGVIQQSGAWYSYGEFRGQGKANFLAQLRHRSQDAAGIHDQILTQVMRHKSRDPYGVLLEDAAGYQFQPSPFFMAPAPLASPDPPPTEIPDSDDDTSEFAHGE